MAEQTFGYIVYRAGEWDLRKRVTGFASVQDAAEEAKNVVARFALADDSSFSDFVTFVVGNEPEVEPGSGPVIVAEDPAVTAAEAIAAEINDRLSDSAVNSIAEMKAAISDGLAAAVAHLKAEG